MKKLIFLLLALSFACSPQKRISNIYLKHPHLKPVDKVETITTEKEVIKYRDTTIYVELPGKDRIDTVYKTTKVYVERGLASSDTIKVSSDYAEAWSWVARRRLNLQIADKDTTLQIRLNDALRDASKYKYLSERKTTVETIKYTPKAVKLFAWLFWILLVGIILYLVWKAKSDLIKRNLRFLIDNLK